MAIGADKRAGFTLVELMVVLVIIGLMASVAVVSLPDGRPSLAQESERFAARLRRAHEEAILVNRAVEVVVTAEGYGFRRREAGGWRPLETAPFAPARWSPGLAVSTDGQTGSVVFDPTGLATAGRFEMTRARQHARVTVDEAGNVQINAAPAR